MGRELLGRRALWLRRQAGVTLIELLVALVVLAVFVTIGIPSFNSIFEKKRLSGAAQALYADLQFARAQAIKSNKGIAVNFNEVAWCYGITDTEPFSDCTCTATSAANCTVEGVERAVFTSAFPKVSLDQNFSGNSIEFDHVRGGLKPGVNNGTASFEDTDGRKVNVVLSPSGRARICSPTEYAGYESC
jgi:prepilin-type N-terminal cleavage/methylation domain-containing protein